MVSGREGVRRYVDDSLALTRSVHASALRRLEEGSGTAAVGGLRLEPTHVPQLNLLTLRAGDGGKETALALQQKLAGAPLAA